MQTNFTLAQLADPDVRISEGILRNCVHCGFCTATCPTYAILGDELDSPRGRIYLIKEMLEAGSAPAAATVKHVDRCLSCLSCMTTCPSGVHYMHLVDHARAHIERHHSRPLPDRALRALLARLLPNPGLLRVVLIGGAVARLFRRWLPQGPVRAMVDLLPADVPGPSPLDGPKVHAAHGPRRKRVALLPGCAQRVLAPGINDATIRLLTRHGVEVVVAKGSGCCGALTHHMGKEDRAHASAKATIDAWIREMDGGGLDAVVVNASGCGTAVKDYGHMFRDDEAYADKAKRVAAIAKDVTELLVELDIRPTVATGQTIAYHSACSMQHGQRIKEPPRDLLRAAGFIVKEVPEGHLCCGSAGTYNMLQPELAGQLRARKVRNIESTRPDAVAAGNLGCITQIAGGTGIPVLHTVELLDWATGGPLPDGLDPDRFASP